jgi:GNAT superfamily N-acetyltransferase
MTNKARNNADFKVSFYTSESLHEDEWTMMMELRNAIDVEEMGVDVGIEFDSNDEHSRQFIGYLGDMPILTGRYRASTHTDPTNGTEIFILLIDRFGVLPDYRNRGFASLAMQALVEKDAAKAYQSLNPTTSSNFEGTVCVVYHLQAAATTTTTVVASNPDNNNNGHNLETEEDERISWWCEKLLSKGFAPMEDANMYAMMQLPEDATVMWKCL